MDGKRFIQIVLDHNGNYIFEEDTHQAWWDESDSDALKNCYIAYGRILETMGGKDIRHPLMLINNWIYYNELESNKEVSHDEVEALPVQGK